MHATSSEISDSPTELRQADPLEVIAEISKRGIGVITYGEATDANTLPLQRLGNLDWKPTPGSQEADMIGNGGAQGCLHGFSKRGGRASVFSATSALKSSRVFAHSNAFTFEFGDGSFELLELLAHLDEFGECGLF